MRRKNREVLLCPAGWSGLSCLEGGGGLGSFWKAAAGKERLRSFLSRQVKLSETSLFVISHSVLLGELATSSLPSPRRLGVQVCAHVVVGLQVDPGVHRTSLREFRLRTPGSRGGRGGGGSSVVTRSC